MMKRALLLMLFPLLSSADPGTATRYLMNEPASLLDIGLVRLNDRLEDSEESLKAALDVEKDSPEKSSFFVGANYNFDDDAIVIEVGVIEFRQTQASEKACKSALKLLRVILPNMIEEAFEHEGYRSASRPDDIFDELEKRTRLECMFADYPSGKPNLKLKADLIGDDYFVSGDDE